MYLEKQLKIISQLGPFERAKTNLDKFVWNFMVLYTTSTIVQAFDKLDEAKTDEADIARMTAELTLRGVFELILERDNGVWN